MKKQLQPSSFNAYLGVVRLHLEDVEHLLGLLTSGETDKALLIVESTQYDSLPELRDDRGTSLRTLEIQVENDSESLRIFRRKVTFHMSGVGVEAGADQELAFRRAVDFLKSKRRLVASMSNLIAGVYGVLATVLWALTFIKPTLFPDRLTFAVWMTAISAAFILLVGFVLPRLQRNLILLEKSHQHQNFWQRHQADIVKGAASGLTGGILGYLLRVIQTMGPK